MELIRELLESRKHKRKAGAKEKKKMIYKEWDGLTDEGVEMFDVEIHYTVTDNGVEKHPYGQGDAEEDLGFETEIDKAVTKTSVTQYDEDGETVIKTFPKGTHIDKLPGWKEKMWDIFEKAVEKDA